MRIRIIRAPGSEEEKQEVDLPARPTLQQIRDVVAPHLDPGAEIDHVTVLWRNRITDMFVDEFGIVKGLPINSRATAIYRAAWLTTHPEAHADDLSVIRGTAILFPVRVWF